MSLLSLSNEILLHIFSYDNLSRNDLYSVISTCRRLYDIGLPSLYRNVCISARPNHLIPGKRITNVDRYFAHSARYPAHLALTRTAELYWETDCPGRANRLFSLLSRFNSIQKLSIECAYPRCITAQLMRHVAAFKRPMLQHIKLTASPEFSDLNIQELATLFFSLPNLETFVLEDFANSSLNGDSGEGSSFPPTNLQTLEFRKSNSLPSGALIKKLLSCHPALKTLVWTVESTSEFTIDASGVGSTLSPLEASLVDLRLTLQMSPQIKNRPNQEFAKINCTGFLTLKNLEIHEYFSLVKVEARKRTAENLGFLKYDGVDLCKRLPASLETLTIYFDPGSSILMDKLQQPAPDLAWAWILEIAKHKAKNFQRLSGVSLLERVDFEYQDLDVHPPCVAAREWDYPLEVASAFQEVGIELKVMLRPKPWLVK